MWLSAAKVPLGIRGQFRRKGVIPHANGTVGARMHQSGQGRRDESPPLEVRLREGRLQTGSRSSGAPVRRIARRRAQTQRALSSLWHKTGICAGPPLRDGFGAFYDTAGLPKMAQTGVFCVKSEIKNRKDRKGRRISEVEGQMEAMDSMAAGSGHSGGSRHPGGLGGPWDGGPAGSAGGRHGAYRRL